MINSKSIEAVNSSVFSGQFRKPLYETYSFANIPGTIEKLLVGITELTSLPDDVLIESGKTYNQVVLFLIDAFGWRFFDRYQNNYPVLQRFVRDGVVSKITSQFPSTTAAHVTAIHTAQPVGQSGVFEWFYYEPKVDAVISPLMYSYAGDTAPGTLLASSVNAKELYPVHNFYQILGEAGVKTHIFSSTAFTPSTYGDVVTAGVSHVHPFKSYHEGLQSLSAVLQAGAYSKQYAYFYHGAIDAAGHDFGPDSEEFNAQVDVFFTGLEQFIADMPKLGDKTLLLMTADHGQTNIDPKTTVYVNQLFPEITECLRTDAQGRPIYFGGSARDLFLYVKEEHLINVKDKLTALLQGKAEVYLEKDLVVQGFFGQTISDVFRERVGNLVILPYKGESVYWYEDGRFEQTFLGHHGGLTSDEMDSIFLALEL